MAWIMMSYAWGDDSRWAPIVHAVARMLQARGHDVWLDVDRITAGRNTQDAMAEGIGGAKLVLAFVSHEYALRPNPKAELNMAVHVGKPIVYVRLQPDFWIPQMLESPDTRWLAHPISREGDPLWTMCVKPADVPQVCDFVEKHWTVARTPAPLDESARRSRIQTMMAGAQARAAEAESEQRAREEAGRAELVRMLSESLSRSGPTAPPLSPTPSSTITTPPPASVAITVTPTEAAPAKPQSKPNPAVLCCAAFVLVGVLGGVFGGVSGSSTS